MTDVSTAMGLASRRVEPTNRPVPALTIVSHPMPHRVGERLLLSALTSGAEVALSRNAPEFLKSGIPFGTPLVDPFISRKPLRCVPLEGGAIQLVVGDAGAIRVAGVEVRDHITISREQIAGGVVIELVARVVLFLHLAIENSVSTDALGMTGASLGLAQVRKAIEQVIDLTVPVLIRGETGTGKELVARAIHAKSPRRDAPFVAVNLGAIPKELSAAELFGAHKGAFTGAIRDREGFFRAANGGTLFLDEVGEAPADVQVMLLRVLETGELYPVGANTPIAVDVRLIAATDANLEERIRQSQFKAPLLHRLAGYEIRSIPLRERREDIGLLFFKFAHEELAAIGETDRLAPNDPYSQPWLPSNLAALLLRHPWPGNIRQLRNVTRQLVIGSRGKPILDVDLPIVRELLATVDSPHFPRNVAAAEEPAPVPEAPADNAAPANLTTPHLASASVPPDAPRRRKATEVTEAELLAALRASGWDVKAAAEHLGVARSSVYDMIDRCQSIRTAGDLTAEEITQCFHECNGDLDRMVERLEVSKRALNRRVKELGLK